MNNQQNINHKNQSSAGASNRNKQKKNSSFDGFTCIMLLLAVFSAIFIVGDIIDKAASNGNDKIQAVVEKYIVPVEKCYHYSQLDDYGKYIYRQIVEQSSAGGDTVCFEDVSLKEYSAEFKNERISDVIRAVEFDHPEIFWFQGWTSIDYNVISRKVNLNLRSYNFWSLSSNKEELVNEFFAKVDEIVATAGDCASDYECVKFVHDYIIDSTVYDMKVLEMIENDKWQKSSMTDQSAYGPIVEGLSVCAGYAKAFQTIMLQLDYECMYIAGKTLNAADGTEDGNHAWNMIKLGGDYYYFDVTWDDSDASTNEDGVVTRPGEIQYHYFAVTTKEFGTNHADKNFDYPLCTGIDYNYYNREGYLIRRYSEEQLRRAVSDQFRKGMDEISLKFTDDNTMNKANNYLNKKFYEIERACGYTGEAWCYNDYNYKLIYWSPQEEW